MNKIEKRIFNTSLEVRSEEGTESRMIAGSAALFNSESEKLGWFYERIEPGAFDGVMDDDVRALFNHDPNLILGRTKSGTLRLQKNDSGLMYEIDPPDTSVARDLAVSIARGDVSQSSFAFEVGEDRWEMDGEKEVRVIVRINRLYDVSPVTYPAYADTSVAKRSLEQWKEANKPEPEPDAIDETAEIRAKIKRSFILSAKQPNV
jgi:uncharacterized protein